LGGIGVIPNEMASNPTLTACALATRAVSRILERPLDELMAEIGLDLPADLPPAAEPVVLSSPMTATPANGSLPAAKVSAAPINWWDDFPLPSTYKTAPETMLGQIKEAGFAGTELGLNLPWWPRKVNRLLKMYGLEAVGGMWPTHLLTRPYVIEALLFRLILLYLRWVKASVVMVSEFSYSPNRSLKTPLFPSSLPDLSVSQWQRLGKGLLRLQRMAKRQGFTFGYHPHLGTVVITEWQIDRLLVYAPTLKLAPDTGHLALAGVSVAAFMKQHVDRIVHVHLKNVRPPTAARLRQSPTPWLWSQLDGAFTVPGDGGLDFRPVLETLKKAGYTGWIVLEAEQNPAIANPYLYARLGRAYVKEVTGW
jgi:inosose dehydratase